MLADSPRTPVYKFVKSIIFLHYKFAFWISIHQGVRELFVKMLKGNNKKLAFKKLVHYFYWMFVTAVNSIYKYSPIKCNLGILTYFNVITKKALL